MLFLPPNQQHQSTEGNIYTRYIQLLEILESFWNLKLLPEILDISWNLVEAPGKMF